MASSPRYARGITRKPVLYGSWMFATNVVGNPPPVTIFGPSVALTFLRAALVASTSPVLAYFFSRLGGAYAWASSG
jgi:hypothetical protein